MSEFNDTLNRQLLYQVSFKIVRADFGETGINPGDYVIGNFTVVIASSASGLPVSIADNKPAVGRWPRFHT